MAENKSIALLACYFGKLPWYFNYFIHSCTYNPTVTFFIICDDPFYDKPLPPNVIVISRFIDEIKELIDSKMGFKTNIDRPYKLCDFKPAYGHIFSDLLEKYDVWGYCDIDLIFGDIRNFITDDILEDYDIISTRPDWIPGCFLLFKNTPKMNLLYTHSKDYKNVFSSSKHYCFDETNFTHHQFEDDKPYYEIKSEVESMMHVVKKLEAENYLKPYFDMHIIEGGSPGGIRWESGKLIYKNKFEVLLYHLIDFKRHYKAPLREPQLFNKFYISSSKIYHKRLV